MPKRTRYFGARRVVKRLRRKYAPKRTRTIMPLLSSYPRRPTSNRAAFAGAGFPLTLTMKHKWTFSTEVTITDTVTGSFVNCIGMFAPSTATARQPMFFDQMTPIYSRYNVIGAKIRWTVVPAVNAAEQPIKIVAWINENGATGAVNFDDLVEYKKAQVKYSQGGINPDRLVINQKWSTKKHNPGSTMANDELAGSNTANPLESPRFQLNYRKMNNVSTPTSYFITADVTYIAVWSELKEIAGS